MTPEDPKVDLELARAIAEIGTRRNVAPADLLIQALFALCPIVERLRYGPLAFGAVAMSVLSRYRELLGQAAAPARPPSGKEPPA